jgi:hypothetical protein
MAPRAPRAPKQPSSSLPEGMLGAISLDGDGDEVSASELADVLSEFGLSDPKPAKSKAKAPPAAAARAAPATSAAPPPVQRELEGGLAAREEEFLRAAMAANKAGDKQTARHWLERSKQLRQAADTMVALLLTQFSSPDGVPPAPEEDPLEARMRALSAAPKPAAAAPAPAPTAAAAPRPAPAPAAPPAAPPVAPPPAAAAQAASAEAEDEDEFEYAEAIVSFDVLTWEMEQVRRATTVPVHVADWWRWRWRWRW